MSGAQPTIIYFQLCSPLLDRPDTYLQLVLSVERDPDELGDRSPAGDAAADSQLRLTGRRRQAIGSGPPGTIATACQPVVCRLSTNVEYPPRGKYRISIAAVAPRRRIRSTRIEST